MEYEYSGTMKKLLAKPKEPMLKFILILLMCLMAAFGIFTYWSSLENANFQKEHVIEFDPLVSNYASSIFSKNMPANIHYSYSSLTPQYLTDPFASSDGGTINYCIALDAKNNPYVVAIDADKMDQYQAFIEYLYSESEDIPAAITIKGIPEKMSDSIGTMAIEAINTLTGKKVADTANYSTVIGTLYLNTTKVPEPNYKSTGIYILMIIGLAIIYRLKIIPQNKCKGRQKNTLNKFNSLDLFNIDQELILPSSSYFDTQNLYITENYLISKVCGLDIIPKNDIVHIYGYFPAAASNHDQIIMAVTGDGVKHEIAIIPSRDLDNSIKSDIIEKIKQSLPNIKYGFETSFYTKSNTIFNLDSYNINENNTENKSNLFLGIIGAIIGATLGSIIWIAIGKIGFIAGIAGFIMVIFSMQGYMKLAGSIDKRGQIISICIALFMIFVANYTSYALEICKSYNIADIINAFKRLPRVLTAANLWGSFAKNLVVGYLLSIWSCYKLLKTVFTKVGGKD